MTQIQYAQAVVQDYFDSVYIRQVVAFLETCYESDNAWFYQGGA